MMQEGGEPFLFPCPRRLPYTVQPAGHACPARGPVHAVLDSIGPLFAAQSLGLDPLRGSSPFAPPTPPARMRPRSPVSSLLRKGLTSRVRASSASAVRLPDADRTGSCPPVGHETSQVPTCSLFA